MTYAYARGSKEIDRDFPIGEAPSFVMVGGHRYNRVFSASVYIPPYMRAPGAKGSSADSCDRQGAYLASEKHKADRRKDERMTERAVNAKSSLNSALLKAYPKFEKAKHETALKQQAAKKAKK